MQQKRKYYSRPMVLFMAVIGVTVAVVAVLAIKEIKPPQQVIEKELDAGALANR